MSRRDHSFLAAIIVSLVLHALLLEASIRYSRYSWGGYLPPPKQSPQASAIYIAQRDASLEFGAVDGHGNAANASPGDLPMLGRDGDQTQAFLSRDPVGPGRVGDDPSMSVLPQVVSPTPPSPGLQAEKIGVPSQSADLKPPQVKPPPTPPLPPNEQGHDATNLVRTKDSPIAPPDSTKGGGSTGSTPPAADPAIMSDSESDPFAPGMKVDFRDGRVEARLGRKVKTVRPKLSLAAQYDLQSTIDPSIRVSVHIDANGAVSKVDIVKSSGSDGADQAVIVALISGGSSRKKTARIGRSKAN